MRYQIILITDEDGNQGIGIMKDAIPDNDQSVVIEVSGDLSLDEQITLQSALNAAESIVASLEDEVTLQ